MASISPGDLWCFFFLSEPDDDPKPCPPGATTFEDYCFILEPVWLTGDEAFEHCRSLGTPVLNELEYNGFFVERAIIGSTGAVWRPEFQPNGKLNKVCKENALYLISM